MQLLAFIFKAKEEKNKEAGEGGGREITREVISTIRESN